MNPGVTCKRYVRHTDGWSNHTSSSESVANGADSELISRVSDDVVYRMLTIQRTCSLLPIFCKSTPKDL